MCGWNSFLEFGVQKAMARNLHASSGKNAIRFSANSPPESMIILICDLSDVHFPAEFRLMYPLDLWQ